MGDTIQAGILIAAVISMVGGGVWRMVAIAREMQDVVSTIKADQSNMRENFAEERKNRKDIWDRIDWHGDRLTRIEERMQINPSQSGIHN